VFALPQERKRTKNKPPKRYRNPVIMAQEWQSILDRENYTPADLARKLGVSRARVTQVLRLLRLT
jgi:ParB-like chromosome segregation protein Spo0J